MTDPNQPDEPNFARGATTLVEVLNRAQRAGFGGSFDAASDGAVRCVECGNTSPAEGVEVSRFHRLEGASDAADALIVVEATCPRCGCGGTLILGYGPAASAADAAVLAELPFSSADDP